MAGLKEHIFLIGFMGCGKSTNAECLAEMTGARQVEMDQMIVENEGMAIADIFEEKGEAYFRELETELIKSFAGVEPAVISCGGGAVLKEENVRLMKESGKIVLLTAEPGTIYERVKDSIGDSLPDDTTLEKISNDVNERSDGKLSSQHHLLQDPDLLPYNLLGFQYGDLSHHLQVLDRKSVV